MSGQPEIPQVPERDQYGGDELPTYDDLAVQNGPNSRQVLIVAIPISPRCSLLNFMMRLQVWALERMDREEVRNGSRQPALF